MSKLELVASAISSMINVPVKTYDECLAKGWKKIPPEQFLDIGRIHESSLNRYGDNLSSKFPNNNNDDDDLYFPIIVNNNNSPSRIIVRRISQPFQIFVNPLSGGSHTMLVYPHTTVLELKYAIKRELGYDIRPLRLVFADKQLDDNKTLSSYNIRKGNTVQILFRAYGGFNFYVIKKDFLSPKYDYDFSNLIDDGKIHTRGKELYKRPYGWNRIALNVGKYGYDEKWLGSSGKSDEWPVSYHGTRKDFVDSIADKGYLLKKGKRFKYGKGIYSTPDIDIAEEYATEFKSTSGVVYKVVFQNRVNPKGMVKIEDCDYCPIKKENSEFVLKSMENVRKLSGWVVPDERDIRPYGLCIKKV
ncbi:unnamed protein product [Rhizophagus irregularis]|nr:unnamed protein product [Rhizophagus irregularis]